MFKYLFGPVPSRRLGLSLGVDMVPHKVCSLDCIYCEVGKTTGLSAERKEYIPYSSIIEELERYFESEPDPDYFTFSGSGEPTLNSSLGKVVDFIKSRKPNIPIAILTNASLFKDPQVRKELLQADLILPSIDAASDETLNAINRPVIGLSASEHIEGLEQFSREFTGDIWLEVMIIPGYNDHLDELNRLKEAILRINPSRIQLNTLDRPGTIEGIRAASRNELQQIINLWAVPNVEIISSSANRKHHKAFKKDIEGTILETIRRRPCTLDDLSQFLDLDVSEINKYLDSLEEKKRIRAIWEERGLFYASIERG